MKYPCPFSCEKIYARNYSLKKHVEQQHIGNAKKFSCEYEGCIKYYYDKTSLENHKNKHLGVKPYKCVLC